MVYKYYIYAKMWNVVPLPLHGDIVARETLIWPCVYEKWWSLDLSCSHMFSWNDNLSFS
jgi:hypothetical protein